MGCVALLLRHHLQGVTAVPERVRQSTCNAKVLGSIPEALKKDFPTLVRGNYSACPDGAPSILRTGSIKNSQNSGSGLRSYESSGTKACGGGSTAPKRRTHGRAWHP